MMLATRSESKTSQQTMRSCALTVPLWDADRPSVLSLICQRRRSSRQDVILPNMAAEGGTTSVRRRCSA